MKRMLIAALMLASAATAAAQVHAIQTTRNPYGTTSSFSIGPRLSNYSTDIDAGPSPFETGRQTAFGLTGDYRTGTFILDFQFDHDPENGVSLSDIVIDVGNYERDRTEATVGFVIAETFDIHGGIRLDSIRVGGASIFGAPFLSDLELDHQALTAGFRLAADVNPQVGFYLLGRGYLGSAKFDIVGDDVNTDTIGYRGEAGLEIRIGESKWWLSPALEYEHLETDDLDIRIDTNRFMLNFIWRN
jgi:hypothetical protein